MSRLALFPVSLLMTLLLAGCQPRAPLPAYGEVTRFELTDQQNRPFDSSQLKGHVWVADFIYTTCGAVCPRLTSQMRQVQDALSGSNVRLVSFTVDPAHDTPERLEKYARAHGADDKMWRFLTGPVKTLQELDRNAFKLGNVDGSLEHSTRFVLIDGRAQIRGYYETSEADAISRLIGDAKLLMNRQS